MRIGQSITTGPVRARASWFFMFALSLAVMATLVFPPLANAQTGRLTGGVKYDLPDWFKESFLDLADDAAEAAEADRHLMVYMHMDECPYCEAVLKESIVESDYNPWLRKRFDVIAINVKGDREVAFSEELQVTEKELADALLVRQTPAVIFMDALNKPILRVNGYRTPIDFKRILDFVDSKAYLSTDLTSFVREQAAGRGYALRPHPRFSSVTDLSRSDKGVMVIFEDRTCTACDLLHDTLLKDPEVDELLKQLTVVRLDAASQAPLITPGGKATTPEAWAGELGLTVRPGFVLFGDGEERLRIEGVLRHFHFTTALRYLAGRKYDEHETYRDFSRTYRESLLNAGIDVDLGRQ